MPKVSIILPTYNGEQYLAGAIESVISQTFEDWELIIVDDCSTDSTPSIISEYVKKDSRIRSVRNEVNSKLPASLNIGFSHAEGEYYTWTSDDNEYYPQAIQKMVCFLDDNKECPMVTAKMRAVDDSGNDVPTPVFNLSTLILSDNLGACFMYRKTAADAVGEYDENLFLVEDYDYWLRIYFKFGFIGHIDETMYCYRFHSNSLTVTRRSDVEKKEWELKNKYFKEIMDRGNNCPEIICGLYYRYLEHGGFDSRFHELKEFVPEYKYDHQLPDDDKRVIIYGAGRYGSQVHDKLGDRAAFFSDGDEKKTGGIKEGLEIIPIKKMISLSNEYHIVVAVSYEKIYYLIRFLCDNGVKEFCSYAKLIKKE